MEPPSSKSDQRLQILLADYEACREDERVQYATLAAVIGILVTIVGLMVAAVTQTCEFSDARTCIAAPEYILAGSPTIPIALLAYLNYILVIDTLRSYYMRGLENEMRDYLEAPIVSLGEIMPASYMGIVHEVTSHRRGRVIYRLIVYLMLLAVIMIFGGYTSYVALHLTPAYQAGMAAGYGSIAILFVRIVSAAIAGGRSFFDRAARDFLNNRPGTTLPVVRAGDGGRIPAADGSLIAYLIYPRPEDWTKWLITPALFLAVAWSSGNFSHWRTLVELWLVLEYLIYAARYQWNDIRGVDEDSAHSERLARRRLPVGPAARTRRSILVSLVVALGRVAVALVIGSAFGLLGQVSVLLALVLVIAFVYEALRSARPSTMGARPTVGTVAIWCAVGLGYGVRAGLGMVTGGFAIRAAVTWVGLAFFVVFGIMFVTMAWALEAASLCWCREEDGEWLTKSDQVVKAHIMALLRYVPIEVEARSNAAWSPDEDGTRRAILLRRGRLVAPWNVALVLSAGLGGTLGAALAHISARDVSDILIISLSVAAACVLSICESQRIRYVVAGAALVALVGIAWVASHQTTAILAGAPWLALTIFYVMFRGSSYGDLVGFVPALREAATSFVKLVIQFGRDLLRVAIGNNAWHAGGFDGRQSPSSSAHAATAARQVGPAIAVQVPESSNDGGPSPSTGV